MEGGGEIVVCGLKWEWGSFFFETKWTFLDKMDCLFPFGQGLENGVF